MTQDNNFLYWLKEIEIENLNDKFKNEIYNFNLIKNEYIENNLKINDQKIIIYLKENENKIEKKDGLDENEIRIFNISNWLINLYKIHVFFDEKNMNFNKMWKYKILYFIYAGYIYMSEYIKRNNLLIDFNAFLNDNLNNKEFFINENDVKWFAFKNGPITSHYNYLKRDDDILINFEKIGEKMKKILEGCYLTLNSFSIELLIEESHKTDPWSNKWNNSKISKFMIEMDKKEIKNYFQEIPPFYMRSLDEKIQKNNYKQDIR